MAATIALVAPEATGVKLIPKKNLFPSPPNYQPRKENGVVSNTGRMYDKH